MSQETFVCETVKAVLVELAKVDKTLFMYKEPRDGCQALDGVIDSLAKSLYSVYDTHFNPPQKNNQD